jgi:xylulokinase
VPNFGEKMSSSYSLGIEFSTQSVKLVILDLEKGDICFDGAFYYDREFPHYNTEGGVLPSDSQEIRHTSPFMLIESVDLAFKKLSESGIDVSLIKAVKCDGMQHCTVFVNSMFEKTISSLDPGQNLLKQISTCISRPASPIWEDRSTAKEAGYLTDALENEGGILKITGNRAELRFPASQILKWAPGHSQEYENTSRIFILSAFITSILSGKLSFVDTGDGWGANLNNLDIDNPGWSEKVIRVMDRYLEQAGLKTPLSPKLGKMDHYDAAAGTINPYFTEKYGIAPDTVILTGTGDNPATLLGCGGNIVVSLGSSYTVNGVMEKIVPSKNGEYNVFGYTKGTAMALSVITNGGKVQDHFLREYVLKNEERSPDITDWKKFINLAGDPLLSCDEKLLLPYLLDESVPLRKKGIVRDNFPAHLAGVNVRALILSQVLSLRLHSDHLGEVKELCVVGGGARNSMMMQWIADAFDAETYTIENPAVAAPLGCAISAAAEAINISYKEAAKNFVRKDPSSVRKPIPENVKTMHGLVQRYNEFENIR